MSSQCAQHTLSDNNVAPKALIGGSTFVVAVTPACTRVGLGCGNLEQI